MTRDQLLTVVSRHVSAVHVALVRRTRGRVGSRFRGGQVLLLTHRGRRSGRLFTTPLLHVRDGEHLVVAASNGGIDAEPQWALNLEAEPAAEVELAGRRFPVRARRAEGAERERLWQLLLGGFSGYDGYQAQVSRQIGVIVLTPVG
ncbi:nitroreductase family deazaflavin-dependent oxidoreductase [Blastococcus sp. SYSU D00820]